MFHLKTTVPIATGFRRDEDTLTSLAGRIARFDRELEKEDREEIEKIMGKPMKQLLEIC